MIEELGFFERMFAADRRVRLYDEDPDLFDGVPDAARAAVSVRLLSLDRGPWDPTRVDGLEPDTCLGLLILGGSLVHSIVVGSDPRSELAGPGDVIRPWVHDDHEASIPFESHWQVVGAARVAVLDERFVALTCRWPKLLLAIAERLARRSRWLALQLAIMDLRRVDDRLMVFFWHLADRWGRVGRDGVLVSLPVTHDVLSQLVCAQRPTVTSALRRLERSGRLRRGTERTWLLHPDPPAPPRRPAPTLA